MGCEAVVQAVTSHTVVVLYFKEVIVLKCLHDETQWVYLRSGGTL